VRLKAKKFQAVAIETLGEEEKKEDGDRVGVLANV
jgi:hypothetical protein